MRKILSLILVLSILFSALSVYADEESAQKDDAVSEKLPDASVTEGCHSLDAQMGILGERQLIRNCTAAFLYEYTTDTLLYSWNGDMQIAPASLVKIVTALIAIQEGNLEDQITISTASFSSLPYDAAMTTFYDGEILTLEDLLNCMMLDSANNAAISIAEHIAGTQEAFVVKMNEYVQDLGCTNTHFTNAHGMHDSNQYSTCRDIARILDEAVDNEAFMKIFGAVYYTIPKTNKYEEIRVLTTDNFHLTQDELETYYDGRVTGGRTGVDLNNDRCIASTASKGDLKMICVVIGAKDVHEEDGYIVTSFGGYHEVSDLLDYGYDGYKASQILYDGQIVKQIEVENGECDLTIGARKSVSTIIPSDIYLEDLNFVYSDTSNVHSAPIQKGDYVSTVKITYGNLCLAEADLYAMNSVRTFEDSYYIEEKNNAGSVVWTVILIILLIAVVIAFVVFALPRIRIIIRRNKRRRRQVAAQRRRS